MSSIVIKGNTSGQVEIAAPDVAGSTTLTMPTTDGTVITNNSTVGDLPKGPAFQAWLSANQTLSTSAWQKVNFDTTEFDTTSDFDTVNYRYIPSVAGYYQINMAIGRSILNNAWLAALYKNGSEYTRGEYAANDSYGVTASMLVYLNGTTDYIEAYVFNGPTAGNIWGIQQRTHFDGFLARAV
jgi:hypothetical protein